ncbi:uncharacterized protein LOC117701928 isoform X1 [Arvicanthis niloticus]|uniref:uncharacterized protein LOC117701928 isoform X1 n=1 Tax=Arvicanthis niloticus TaxID=61156 RepID=UPI00402B80A4
MPGVAFVASGFKLTAAAPLAGLLLELHLFLTYVRCEKEGHSSIPEPGCVSQHQAKEPGGQAREPEENEYSRGTRATAESIKLKERVEVKWTPLYPIKEPDSIELGSSEEESIEEEVAVCAKDSRSEIRLRKILSHSVPAPAARSGSRVPCRASRLGLWEQRRCNGARVRPVVEASTLCYLQRLATRQSQSKGAWCERQAEERDSLLCETAYCRRAHGECPSSLEQAMPVIEQMIFENATAKCHTAIVPRRNKRLQDWLRACCGLGREAVCAYSTGENNSIWVPTRLVQIVKNEARLQDYSSESPDTEVPFGNKYNTVGHS